MNVLTEEEQEFFLNIIEKIANNSILYFFSKNNFNFFLGSPEVKSS